MIPVILVKTYLSDSKIRYFLQTSFQSRCGLILASERQVPMAGTVSDPTEVSARTVWGGCNPEGQLSRQSCRSPGTENPADAGLLLGGYRPQSDIPRPLANVSFHGLQSRKSNRKSVTHTDSYFYRCQLISFKPFHALYQRMPAKYE